MKEMDKTRPKGRGKVGDDVVMKEEVSELEKGQEFVGNVFESVEAEVEEADVLKAREGGRQRGEAAMMQDETPKTRERSNGRTDAPPELVVRKVELLQDDKVGDAVWQEGEEVVAEADVENDLGGRKRNNGDVIQRLV